MIQMVAQAAILAALMQATGLGGGASFGGLFKSFLFGGSESIAPTGPVGGGNIDSAQPGKTVIVNFSDSIIGDHRFIREQIQLAVREGDLA